MDRLTLLSMGAALALMLSAIDAGAQPVTNVNIVTGSDFSHSVTLEEHFLVQEGMALALVTPEVIRAIQAGPHRSIGFAMFGWHVSEVPLVSWTIIRSEEDARTVALRIRIAVVKQRAEEEQLRRLEHRFGRPTDLSNAIHIGARVLLSAPYQSERLVLNIVGNGRDNVGTGPAPARDLVLRMGVTINGVAIGPDEGLVEYFRRNVIGGPRSFVVHVPTPEAMVELLKRKLLADMAVVCICGIDQQPLQTAGRYVAD